MKQSYGTMILVSICFLILNGEKCVANVISGSLELRIEKGVVIQLTCPMSIGWETKEQRIRSCRIQKNVEKFDELVVEKIQPSSSDFSKIDREFILKFEFLPEVRDQSGLEDYFKKSNRGTLPRYLNEGLWRKLSTIKSVHGPITVYDLSLDSFDPREPSSPDIFVVRSDGRGAVVIRDANHLRFKWSEFKIEIR